MAALGSPSLGKQYVSEAGTASRDKGGLAQSNPPSENATSSLAPYRPSNLQLLSNCFSHWVRHRANPNTEQSGGALELHPGPQKLQILRVFWLEDFVALTFVGRHQFFGSFIQFSQFEQHLAQS